MFIPNFPMRYCNIAIAMEQMFKLYLNLDFQYKAISNKFYFLYTQCIPRRSSGHQHSTNDPDFLFTNREKNIAATSITVIAHAKS